MAFSYGCVRSYSLFLLTFVASLASFSVLAAIEDRGLVQNPDGNNVALTVGVPDFLPGIDIDVRKMNDLTSKNYGFRVTSLERSKGTSTNILAEMEKHSEAAGSGGTMLFYFSGHGNPGSLEAYERTLAIHEVRAALERGRRKQGPLERLVMIIDSCHSGSLLDPMRSAFPTGRLRDDGIASSLLVEAIARELAPSERAMPYWKNLFVFASSRADQTSLAGEQGSRFTNAFVKSFDEIAAAKGTMADLVSKTQTYTVGHNPVARFSPPSLSGEKLMP